VVSCMQRTLDRLGQAERGEVTVVHVGFLMRLAARTAFSTPPDPGI
jgi:hypothetical protein